MQITKFFREKIFEKFRPRDDVTATFLGVKIKL